MVIIFGVFPHFLLAGIVQDFMIDRYFIYAETRENESKQTGVGKQLCILRESLEGPEPALAVDSQVFKVMGVAVKPSGRMLPGERRHDSS